MHTTPPSHLTGGPPQPGQPSYASTSRPLPQGYTHAASDGYVQQSRPALDDQRNATSPSRYSRSHPSGYVQPPGMTHHDSSPDPDTPPAVDERGEAERMVEMDRRRAEVERQRREQETSLAMLALREAQSQEVLRHGFHEVNSSEDYMAQLSKGYYLYWTEDRFKRKEKDAVPVEYWLQPPKHRTAAAAIFLCLRFGFDPPDVSKTDPCARLEAWTDPWSMPREKALEMIGKKITEQYESLAPAYHKIKFKTICDVPVDDCKRAVVGSRRNAKHERCLMHYNGHGVPRPTPSGEIWVFNKAYTQYIPISLYDLMGWLGAPSVYVWDCNNAGNIVNKVIQFAAQRDSEADDAAANAQQTAPTSPSGTVTPDWATGSRMSMAASTAVPQQPSMPPRFVDTIQLAACAASQSLPSDPSLPADVFTSCLTSPIEMAMRFYVLQNTALKERLVSTSIFSKDLDRLHLIPGRMEMRRTPLGELTWIFTSVTDAIAWNCLPRDLFARIFRGDLVLAALFRGFLLAERVLRAYGCTPISVPALPETHTNELWKSWDLALDMCLSQLPGLWKYEHEKVAYDHGKWPRGQAPPKPVAYQFSAFFAEQLTAFEVWLDEAARMAPEDRKDGQGGTQKGEGAKGKDEGKRFPPPPPQLPIVLQVLLSQAHRLRALILLCRFMDMGPWAVHLSLSIGIFQYVLKLLQAPAPELKPVLIFIWARILTIHPDGRYDLFRHNVTRQNTQGEAPIEYFTKILHPEQDLPIPNITDHKAMCAFILSVACRNHVHGQQRLLQLDVHRSCLVHLDSPSDMLRQWSALLLGHLWDRCDEVKGAAVAFGIHVKLSNMLKDKSPEVRAAVLYALGTLVGTSSAPLPTEHGQGDEIPRAARVASLSGADPERTGMTALQQMVTELGIAMACVSVAPDGSAMVRKELVVLLSAIVAEHQGHFIIAAYEAAQMAKERLAKVNGSTTPGAGGASGHRASFALGRPDHSRSSSAITAVSTSERDGGDVGMDPAILSVEFSNLYTVLLDLSLDPFPEVSQVACLVIDYIHSQLLETPLGSDCSGLVENALARAAEEKQSEAMRASLSEGAGSAKRASVVNGAAERGPASSASTSNISLLRSKGLVNAVKSLTHRSSSANLAASAAASDSTNVSPNIAKAIPTAKSNGTVTAPESLVGSPDTFQTAVPSVRHRKRDLQQAPGQAFTPYASSTEPPSPAELGSVISRLRESDRIRRRRRRASSSGGQTPSSSAPGSPSSESFFDDDMSPLPLRSDFYDWSARYFLEPQMKDTGEDQAGSKHFYAALWRKHRNEKVIIETQPLKEVAATSQWDSQVFSRKNPSIPTQIAMHQFEDHLIAADEDGFLTVYDWKQNRQLNRFSNRSPSRTKITTLKLVNEDDVALLLTGSSDGTVRLFRDYDSSDCEVVTAFRGLPSIEPSSRAEAGLIADWQQTCGQLLIGGNTREIRVWDAYRETSHYQILTRANSCITSLTSDQVAGFIVAAGFGDGSVRIYDRRKSPRDAMIRAYRGHHSAWIQNIHMQRGGQRELLSGDLMGEVYQWDIRYEQPLSKLHAHQEGMPVMAVHEHAPVFATGSASNIIKVWPIGTERPISKFRDSSSASVNAQKAATNLTAMAFHPHRMILATGSSEPHNANLSLYQCDVSRPALATF